VTAIVSPHVVVFIHQIDVSRHPTTGGGWRWAVHVGAQGPSDLAYCANAGRAETRTVAAVIGESHGAAVARAIRMFGISAAYHNVIELDYDPIPADTPVGMWKKTAGGV
jgi:hypothetical protein